MGILIVQQVMLMAIASLVGTWLEGRDGHALRRAAGGLERFVGTLVGFALFVFLALLYFIGFVFWFQDYPRGGNFAGALAFAALTALTVASLGIALGAWFADRERAFQVLLATSVPFVFMAASSFRARPCRRRSTPGDADPDHAGHLRLRQAEPDGRDWSEIRPSSSTWRRCCCCMPCWPAGPCTGGGKDGADDSRHAGLVLALVLLLAGCASRPANPPLAQYDHDYGYRVSNWQAERGDPEFGLVVAMSGGGTRAAAFSYGILGTSANPG